MATTVGGIEVVFKEAKPRLQPALAAIWAPEKKSCPKDGKRQKDAAHWTKTWSLRETCVSLCATASPSGRMFSARAPPTLRLSRPYWRGVRMGSKGNGTFLSVRPLFDTQSIGLIVICRLPEPRQGPLAGGHTTRLDQ